ncbi:hypothetical protein AVEN_15508-1 [Araneus ventricosus]|uniref:DDE-1 domain-containing protein n=1 Tax=Araneus ventricosus TaxID=182803 RepID=A0A4Y2T8H6_ARAVE|nr:hypothetical protein AVEN_15508-1 [Araneus ventricosus]
MEFAIWLFAKRNFQAANEFRSELNNLMVKENLTEEQLYNCDETGLNFKRLPTKSLVSRNENLLQCVGGAQTTLIGDWKIEKATCFKEHCYVSPTSYLYEPKELLDE